MFKRIVTGSDGPHGRGAVALGHAIAGTTSAQLLVVDVQHDLPLRLEEQLVELCAARRASLRGVRDELAPAALMQLVIEASPARALRRTAEHDEENPTHEEADLIVVGSRQPGPMRRLNHRDTAMQVLHGAPCAVAVAPDALPPCRGLKTIGVGLDATAEARAALALALELAQHSGADLRLLAVASGVYPGSADLDADAPFAELRAQLIDDRVHKARSAIEEAWRRARVFGQTATCGSATRRASSSHSAPTAICSCSDRDAGVPRDGRCSAAPPRLSSATRRALCSS